MNLLELKSYIDPSLNEIVTELLVDGKQLTDYKKNSFAVDLSSLETSILDSGEFYIITCTCGYPGCGEIKQGIQVKQSEETIEWQVTGFGQDQYFCFTRDHYRSAFFTGIEKLEQLMEKTGLKPASDTAEYYFNYFKNTDQS